jgi:GNAT superfamily N-acetyltransferase
MDDLVCSVCGLLYDSSTPADARHHKKFHDVYVNGPKTKLPDGIHCILPKSPFAHRLVAQEVARSCSRECSFLLQYYANASEDFRAYKTTAFLYVAEGRAVGILVGREYSCSLLFRLNDRASSLEMPETLCCNLEVAWVLESHRNRGIGKKLLTEFIAKLDGKPFGVQWPISPDGERLLRSLRLTEFWIR